jgi:hypothetical protein
MVHNCEYTIPLWFPCLDGLIQTRGNIPKFLDQDIQTVKHENHKVIVL